LLLLGSASGHNARAADPAPPNILFIFTDDHATQAIGAYGSRINETPNIDRLAREGMLFRNSFCANSLCGPSRACILTGKHSHANGFLRNGNRFDSSQTTFPRLLQARGYQTAVIGKWHLETNPVGFDYWEILPDQGSYYNPAFLQMDGTRQRQPGYCTDLITEKALQWLKHQRDSDRPFVLMCQHKAPHRNWAPAPRHFHTYDGQEIAEPETLRDDYAGRSALLTENEMSIRHHLHWRHDMKFKGPNRFPKYFADEHPNGEYDRMTPEQQQQWDAEYEPENEKFIAKMEAGDLTDDEILRWKYQRYVKDYLKCVAAVDDGVGQLLDYLDESGLAENTVVIYSSDQGFYLGEHGWYDKRWMFEESLQMPLIVRWPGRVPAGVESMALVQNIDYAPTFLDLAGAPIPRQMQGCSLLPVLTSPAPPPDWRDAIYYAYYENAAVHQVPVHDGIRTRRHKLMWFPRTREWQLFDLENDPREMTSRHDDPEYTAVLAGLQRRYRDLRSYYGVNSATIPETRADLPWWRDRDRACTQRASQGDVDLVFIGDSITQAWEEVGAEVWRKHFAHHKPLNLGFSGDRTENVIWRLEHGNLDGIHPKAAVVMIGTNNTGHVMQAPDQVAAGIESIVQLIRSKLPDAKILLLGVFPRDVQPLDPMRLNNVAINQYIRRLDDGQHVHFRDIGHIFLEDDGTISPDIMPDALHLSAQGYQRWADAIEPILREWGL
jgi:N-acetylglucosamine-6-sulfatase